MSEDALDGPGSDALSAGVGELCESAARRTFSDGAALAVLTRRAHTRELMYATDVTATRLDELQYTLGEGPCLDAYLYDRPEFHPDLTSAAQTSRWPSFAAEATQLGVQSLFAFPVSGLRRPSGPSGVLELYRRVPGSLTEAEHAAAEASAAAIAQRLQANWASHLTHFASAEQALDAAATDKLNDLADPFTRTQIHVATGVLAVQLGIHPDHALDRLRAHAYAAEQRISSVAADIIARRLTLQ